MREMVFTNGVEQQHQPATFIPKDLATPVVQSSHTIHTQPLGTPDVGQTQALSGILRPVRGFQTLLIGGSLLALVLTTDHDLGQYGTEVCFSFSLEIQLENIVLWSYVVKRMAEGEVASSI